jgi:hypothetical protein
MTLIKNSYFETESVTIGLPKDLHPDTKELLINFVQKMGQKLRETEIKHNYGNSWKYDNWQLKCGKDFITHIEKGNPIDVANYCAFMDYHNWELK